VEVKTAGFLDVVVQRDAVGGYRARRVRFDFLNAAPNVYGRLRAGRHYTAALREESEAAHPQFEHAGRQWISRRT
jgi:hypothetical protein